MGGMIFPNDCLIDKELMALMLLRGTQHGMPLALPLPRCYQQQQRQSWVGTGVPAAARWSWLHTQDAAAWVPNPPCSCNAPRSCSSCRSGCAGLSWCLPGSQRGEREGNGMEWKERVGTAKCREDDGL